MSSARAATRDLSKLLASVAAPLYVVDEQHRIVFLNQAAADWLEVPATDLLGRQCHYQSAGDQPPAALADGLCPPPEAFYGTASQGIVNKAIPEGPSQRRRADFIPLPGEGDRWIGVLAILHREPLGDEDQLSGRTETLLASAAAQSNESQQLHELLRRFRRDHARWHHVDRLIGQSSAMQRVRQQVALAATARSTVLIVGPAGIGKQHVARSIHAAMTAEGALLPVACAALPSDQLLSTILTFADRCKSATDGATLTLLLLDVDRTPPEVQLELTRWLDSVPDNLRIISTANAILESLARKGAFRSDLAQRLSTLIIELPPLSDRREDIPLLAQALLEDLNSQGEKQLRGFKPEALDRLVLHAWPGQVDELAAVVRQAFVQAEGFEIVPANLPKQLWLAAEAARYPRPAAETIDLEKFLAQVETELIERALRQAKGNKAGAARLLGITRPRLYRRMVQLGLEPDENE